MFSNRTILILLIILASCTLDKKEPRKIYFINNDSLEILNGHVKQMNEAPVDNIYSTNPGQDYSIVDINKQGDVTKIITGFHGSIFRTYYTAKYNPTNKKVLAEGYIKYSDDMGMSQDPNKKATPIDTVKKLLLLYRYNKKGEIVNHVVNPGKPNVDSSTYKYNDKGYPVEIDYYANTKLLMDVIKYKYDSKNNLIELKRFHRNRLMDKIRYEYKLFDSENNWLDMIVHSEDFWADHNIETSEMHRKITYY